jgi:predicted O-methyltransferase YrrM
MNWIKKNVSNYLKNSLSSAEKLDLTFTNPAPLDDTIINASPGGWSIDKAVTKALMRIIQDKNISTVVEIGAGFSSIIFHYSLNKSASDFEVFSIEENVDWFKIPEDLKELVDRDSMSFQTGGLSFVFGKFGIHASYMIPEKENLKFGVELVFVDGPQYYYGREGALDGIFEKLKVGCLIVMDDAERYTEQCVIYKWLKVYKGLELIYFKEKFGDKGLAILKVKKPLKRHFSIDAFLLGMMQGIKRLLNFKAIKEKQAYLKSSEIS